MKNHNKNFFEDDAFLKVKYSDKRAAPSEYPNQLANYVLNQHYKNTGSLLDLGCGRGDMMRAFREEGFICSGTDISKSSESYTSGFPFKAANILEEDLPYDDNSFDFVWSKSVIEHISDPMKLLNESIRVLKDEGKAIIMVPSWIHNSWGPYYVDFSHVSVFTKVALKDGMKIAGYEDVKVYHFYQLPHIWKLPIMRIFCKFISLFPIPYQPFYYDSWIKWPAPLNKYVRFSNEVMLLAVGTKKSKCK
jgi:SAM-dependent methyltransferase